MGKIQSFLSGQAERRWEAIQKDCRLWSRLGTHGSSAVGKRVRQEERGRDQGQGLVQ